MGEGGGGGGRKAQNIMYTHAHHEREARSPLRLGSRTRVRALEALGVFDALSCYLSLIFKHSDTKWDKKSTVDQILGGWGGRSPVVPSGGTRGGHGGANAPPVRGFAPHLPPQSEWDFYFIFFYFFFFFYLCIFYLCIEWKV